MNENIKKLFKLMEENPTLRVMPFVRWEIVAEDWGYWMASFGDCFVDEVCVYKDRIYWKSEIDALEEEICDDEFDSYGETKVDYEEFVKQKAQEQEWEKVIVVRIELPDYVDIGGAG